MRMETCGNQIEYTDEGSGPTLLFVHAGLWSFVWREVIARLKSDFRCVTLDFPGAGLSTAQEGYATTIDSHSAVLEAFADRLGLRDVTIVAHDLGGPVALGWAARRPELVRAIVAVQAFGWRPDERGLRAMLRLMGSRPIPAVGVATNLVALLSSTSFGVGRSLGREGRRAFRAPYRTRAARRPFFDLMRSALRTDYTQIEEALRTTLHDRPVLTIFGSRNDPFRFQRRWKALFPDAEQVVVSKGYHFPMADDPDLFAGALRTWAQARIAGKNEDRAGWTHQESPTSSPMTS